ncbi:MAG: mismatch-specific DNA-glycosylase [Gammaproteobacteria bacterium]
MNAPSPPTLPDFVRPGLSVLAVGINPSLHAVRAGYPFAFPRNRFWPALNASRLVEEALEPGRAAMDVLLHRYGIGFTDVVKRPTPGMRDLRAADFARWAPVLADTVAVCRPRWLWFHGMVALRGFCRVVANDAPVGEWGAQPFELFGARCFVTPNPSPANARYSLADIIRHYDALAACVRD